jgi:diguanylate cyclase (GGDEF)-like protein
VRKVKIREGLKMGLHHLEARAEARARDDFPPVASLVAEVERLRREIAIARARIGELEARADVDSLLDIFNRRGFERELKRALAYVKRYGTPAALMYIDLDGFKAVNDRHGHGTGDALIKAVTRELVAHVRASDVVGRLGGDELGVLVWRVDEAQASAKARNLEILIERISVMHGQVQVQVGASVGTSPLLPDATPAEAIEAADRAMYARKQERRDRFLPPLPSPA